MDWFIYDDAVNLDSPVELTTQIDIPVGDTCYRLGIDLPITPEIVQLSTSSGAISSVSANYFDSIQMLTPTVEVFNDLYNEWISIGSIWDAGSQTLEIIPQNGYIYTLSTEKTISIRISTSYVMDSSLHSIAATGYIPVFRQIFDLSGDWYNIAVSDPKPLQMDQDFSIYQSTTFGTLPYDTASAFSATYTSTMQMDWNIQGDDVTSPISGAMFDWDMANLVGPGYFTGFPFGITVECIEDPSINGDDLKIEIYEIIEDIGIEDSWMDEENTADDFVHLTGMSDLSDFYLVVTSSSDNISLYTGQHLTYKITSYVYDEGADVWSFLAALPLSNFKIDIHSASTKIEINSSGVNGDNTDSWASWEIYDSFDIDLGAEGLNISPEEITQLAFDISGKINHYIWDAYATGIDGRYAHDMFDYDDLDLDEWLAANQGQTLVQIYDYVNQNWVDMHVPVPRDYYGGNYDMRYYFAIDDFDLYGNNSINPNIYTVRLRLIFDQSEYVSQFQAPFENPGSNFLKLDVDIFQPWLITTRDENEIAGREKSIADFSSDVHSFAIALGAATSFDLSTWDTIALAGEFDIIVNASLLVSSIPIDLNNSKLIFGTSPTATLYLHNSHTGGSLPLAIQPMEREMIFEDGIAEYLIYHVKVDTTLYSPALISEYLTLDGKGGYQITGYIQTAWTLLNNRIEAIVIERTFSTDAFMNASAVTYQREVENLRDTPASQVECGDVDRDGQSDLVFNDGTTLLIHPNEATLALRLVARNNDTNADISSTYFLGSLDLAAPHPEFYNFSRPEIPQFSEYVWLYLVDYSNDLANITLQWSIDENDEEGWIDLDGFIEMDVKGMLNHFNYTISTIDAVIPETTVFFRAIFIDSQNQNGTCVIKTIIDRTPPTITLSYPDGLSSDESTHREISLQGGGTITIEDEPASDLESIHSILTDEFGLQLAKMDVDVEGDLTFTMEDLLDGFSQYLPSPTLLLSITAQDKARNLGTTLSYELLLSTDYTATFYETDAYIVPIVSQLTPKYGDILYGRLTDKFGQPAPLDTRITFELDNMTYTTASVTGSLGEFCIPILSDRLYSTDLRASADSMGFSAYRNSYTEWMGIEDWCYPLDILRDSYYAPLDDFAITYYNLSIEDSDSWDGLTINLLIPNVYDPNISTSLSSLEIEIYNGTSLDPSLIYPVSSDVLLAAVESATSHVIWREMIMLPIQIQVPRIILDILLENFSLEDLTRISIIGKKCSAPSWFDLNNPTATYYAMGVYGIHLTDYINNASAMLPVFDFEYTSVSIGIDIPILDRFSIPTTYL
ncbi:MAG: hypothetical protein E4G98_01905, partial [Promethearchaeota archaeon]